jgi:hypothetical protein
VSARKGVTNASHLVRPSYKRRVNAEIEQTVCSEIEQTVCSISPTQGWWVRRSLQLPQRCCQKNSKGITVHKRKTSAPWYSAAHLPMHRNSAERCCTLVRCIFGMYHNAIRKTPGKCIGEGQTVHGEPFHRHLRSLGLFGHGHRKARRLTGAGCPWTAQRNTRIDSDHCRSAGR